MGGCLGVHNHVTIWSRATCKGLDSRLHGHLHPISRGPLRSTATDQSSRPATHTAASRSQSSIGLSAPTATTCDPAAATPVISALPKPAARSGTTRDQLTPSGEVQTFAVGVDSHDQLYRNPFASPLLPHEFKPDIAEAREKTP